MLIGENVNSRKMRIGEILIWRNSYPMKILVNRGIFPICVFVNFGEYLDHFHEINVMWIQNRGIHMVNNANRGPYSQFHMLKILIGSK